MPVSIILLFAKAQDWLNLEWCLNCCLILAIVLLGSAEPEEKGDVGMLDVANSGSKL